MVADAHNRPVAEMYFHTLLNRERLRQNRLWGEQTHSGHVWVSILTEELGELAQAVNDNNMAGVEEELVQIAAVCCAAFAQHRIDQPLAPAWGKHRRLS